MTPPARRVDVGGHALRVKQSGAGPSGAPSFLCLHGLADTLEIWRGLAPALGERGQLVLVDQRAHGESDAPPGPYRREDLAADVCALLDRLAIARAVLVGHSMGGIVAMTTALAHPDRVAGLVLIGTASQCSERVAAWYEKIALAAETDGLPGLSHAIFGASAEAPSGVSAAGRQVRGDARGMAHVTRCLKSLYNQPLTPRLGEIGCPVLLVVGDRDPMGPGASAIIQRNLPGAVLEVVPGCGHWVHVEEPGALLAAIDRWLGAKAVAR